MNNVVTRSISGAVYVGLIVGAILAGSYWMLWLVMLLAFVAITEFDMIANKRRLPAILRGIDLFTSGMLLLGIYAGSLGDSKKSILLFLFFIILLMARLIAALYIRTDNPLSESGYSLMAQLYITMPMAMLLGMYYSISPAIVLLMFIMIWLNDTGAFCVGSLMGKHRLFERISPKKSWEGFFGGLVFTVLAGVVAASCFSKHFPGYDAQRLAGMGVVVTAFATWGDLVESLIKRTLGIKDSGSIMPGHGGILDRIDSLLFVAPATFIYMLLLMY